MMIRLLILFVLFSMSLYGQEGTTYVLNDHAEKDRYKDVKGSPMLFDDWVMADVITIGGRKIDSLMINYNAFTKEILFNSQGKSVPLETETYMSFQIPGIYANESVDIDETDKLLFIKGVNNKFADQYIQVLYNGSLYKLLKDYYVSIGKQTAQIPGKTITTERFSTAERYYILGPKDLIQVKLNKKDILKSLPKSNELKAFIDQEKLNLKKEKDVIRFMQEYERSMY